MLFRVTASALILGALLVSGSAVQANEQENCETRECQLTFFNPPILKVSRCYDLTSLRKRIDVVTNCHTIVCIDCDDQFTRFERDCDCKVLKTCDRIPARCRVDFYENPVCKDGGAFNVKKLPENCWCVESHRGGYSIFLECRPVGADICDDCGCYELTCKIQICTHPCEEEKDCDCVVVK